MDIPLSFFSGIVPNFWIFSCLVALLYFLSAAGKEKFRKKRAARSSDELLFKQPESRNLGDCPICCLPLPIDLAKSTLQVCCSKTSCNGCKYANLIGGFEAKREMSCPFCRKAVIKTKEECLNLMMKRIGVNDPASLAYQGGEEYDKGDYQKAFEYYVKAAEVGKCRGAFVS